MYMVSEERGRGLQRVPSCHRPLLGPLYRRQARAAAVPVRFALSGAPPPNRLPDGHPQTAGRWTDPSSRAPARLRALLRRAPRSPRRATSTRRARELAHRLRRQVLPTRENPRSQKTSRFFTDNALAAFRISPEARSEVKPTQTAVKVHGCRLDPRL